MDNLSDNEIIKALELCTGDHDEISCPECPYKNDESCYLNSIKDALDLINRLKAENERLTKLTELDDKHIKSLEKAFNNRTVQYRTAKSEARKEFAERLKEKLGDCNIIHDSFYAGYDTNDTWECIDNLLKEMG